MENKQKEAIQKLVGDTLDRMNKFFKKRQTMTALNQRREIKAIHADVKQIYIYAHNWSKADIEKAFDSCSSSMIELQHKLIMCLTI
tara:strand:+ start:1824 stop:2081 length:258 start_codon:yes stop_codon:yes gene_type:complete